MILNSRQNYTSSEDFRDKFINSITPGIIPRDNFINWKQIDDKFDIYKSGILFYSELGRVTRTDEEFDEYLFDGLLSSDNPAFLIKTGFELLGHTGNIYVSNEDYLKLSDLNKKIDSENEEDQKLVGSFSFVLSDLGLRSVTQHIALENYFIGVQVGLESNRRKNVGGEAFKQAVKTELELIIRELSLNGVNCVLKEEDKIIYQDGVTSKKVDFSIKLGEKTLGIEVNFYTASGSKPTEIKRSYGLVNSELERVGVSLVWITDGAGYFDIKNSLKEARDIHKNTYNFKMMKEFFKNDIINFLN
jgi:type II restriction enzyme